MDKVKRLLEIPEDPVSLDTLPLSDVIADQKAPDAFEFAACGNEVGLSIADVIEDKKAVDPLEAVISTSLSRQLSHELLKLPLKRELVLRKRFGVGEKSDHTLEEVGGSLYVTREHIRQLEAKALRFLRHPNRGSSLQSFYAG